jgi:uncharacterized protein (TIGR03067 family)
MTMHGALLAYAGLLLAADAPKGPTDHERIQGVWKIIAEVENGKDTPPRRNEKVRIHLTADKVVITEGDDKRQGTYKLDPSRKPSTIELVPEDGPNKGKKALGIYQLSGDTLTLCLTLQEGKDPPGDFTARAGSGRVLLTLQRDKD